jgi:hypothetical protein
MTQPNVITREQFEAMTPETFPAGKRGESATVWATAGAVQIEGIDPRQVDTMLTAMREVVPLHTDDDGTPSQRYRNAVEESAEVGGGLLAAPVDPKLIDWLNRFGPAIKTDNDLSDLTAHLTAVARQFAMFTALREARPA